MDILNVILTSLLSVAALFLLAALAALALLLGYGYTKLTMLLNVARVFVFRVPVLWAFRQFTSLGAEAVGMTMMVSNVSTGIAAIAIAIPVVRRILKLSREEELPQPFIKEEPQ